MSEPNITEIVRDKYAKAALRVTSGEGGCCGTASTRERLRSRDREPLRDRGDDGPARGGGARLARLRQPDGAGPAPPGRGRAGPRLRRRHRRPALRPARRADRQGLRPRHDRRDAGPRPREPAEGRRRRTSSSSRARSRPSPCPTNTVDVIISNCVINLSADKDRVLAEAFRVLKPGGRFAVSDVVVRGEVPAAIRRSMELWIGCVAGALEETGVPREAGQGGLRGHRPRADARLPRRGRPRVPAPARASTSTPSPRRWTASS